jgi:hypothetical protein
MPGSGGSGAAAGWIRWKARLHKRSHLPSRRAAFVLAKRHLSILAIDTRILTTGRQLAAIIT